MAKDTKTPDKRLSNLKSGKNEKTKEFSSTNQPTPEAKSKGWKELRAERHLSQAIIKEMLGKDAKPTPTFKGYVKSLIDNAKNGNAAAIAAVNKFIEDDVTQIDLTSGGKEFIPQSIILSNGNKLDLS